MSREPAILAAPEQRAFLAGNPIGRRPEESIIDQVEATTGLSGVELRLAPPMRDSGDWHADVVFSQRVGHPFAVSRLD
jgi:hypothetical protein